MFWLICQDNTKSSEDEFIDEYCNVLGLSELRKQIERQKIPSIVTTHCTDKVQYIRKLCNQIYQLVFNLIKTILSGCV